MRYWIDVLLHEAWVMVSQSRDADKYRIQTCRSIGKAEYCDKTSTILLWVHMAGTLSQGLQMMLLQLFVCFLATETYADAPMNYNI